MKQGIIKHVEKSLGIHHSPDLFHVFYEISKGVTAALSSKEKKAEKEYEDVQNNTKKKKEERNQHEQKNPRPIGRRPNFEERIQKAEIEERKVKNDLEKAKKNKETVKEEKKQISKVYHPYDLKTGLEQNAEKVEKLLDNCFARIDKTTTSISINGRKRVEKARRVVKNMKVTIEIFFSLIKSIVMDMKVSSKIKALMHTNLIPSFYLMFAAKKEKNQDLKQRLLVKSQELLSILDDRKGAFAKCLEPEIEYITRVAKECAQYFQRSSSCVEGRNGQLSLKHPGLHRLSDLKLSVLTTIHNFYIKRPDGTTAAERFLSQNQKIYSTIYLIILICWPDQERS